MTTYGNHLVLTGTGTTTSATPKAIAVWEIDIPQKSSLSVFAQAVARDRATGDAAGYAIVATFKRGTGAPAQVGTTTDLAAHENDAAWGFDAVLNGNRLELRATGDGANACDWSVMGTAVLAVES